MGEFSVPFSSRGEWDGADLVIRIPDAANHGSIRVGAQQLWPCARCNRLYFVNTHIISFECEYCADEEDGDE